MQKILHRACVLTLAATLMSAKYTHAQTSVIQPPTASIPAQSTTSVASTNAAANNDPATLREQINKLKARVVGFPEFDRYRDSNAKLPPLKPAEKRVVMFGDSITDNWRNYPEVPLPGETYINRGIGGQTTSQMLLRFRQDVIDLKPAVVVILAGTNDIGFRNGQPGVLEAAEDNLQSMAQLAKMNGIRVVLATLLPLCGSQTARRNPDDILTLNRWIVRYAEEQKISLLDYYPAMLDPATGQLRESITHDCLHPNAEGYRIMKPMVEKAVAEALSLNLSTREK